MLTPSQENVRTNFGQLAVQYYVSGRAAAIMQLLPVTGNLLHHAVEMALKAALGSSHTLSKLKALNHHLPRIWSEFKAAFPHLELTAFDAAVATLHKYEELRYPDSIIANGAMMEFALFREHMDSPRSGPAGVPSYPLVLEDVDALIERILEVANINPRLYTGVIPQDAKHYLSLHNCHGSKW